MKHLIIIVGGLGDTGNSLQKFVFWWKWFGFDLSSFETRWRTDEIFEQKLKRLDKLVDSVKNKYNRISLVGTSAGGSFVFNYLIKYPHKVYKAVNVCGRVKVGKLTGFRNLLNRAKTSKSFDDSVRHIDHNIDKTILPRLMNIRPLWDELVPGDTSYLKGAVNKTIFSIEHLASIFLSLTLFFKVIILFLSEPPLRLRGGRG